MVVVERVVVIMMMSGGNDVDGDLEMSWRYEGVFQLKSLRRLPF